MHFGYTFVFIIYYHHEKRAKKSTKDLEKIGKLDELQGNLYAESLKKSVILKFL